MLKRICKRTAMMSKSFTLNLAKSRLVTLLMIQDFAKNDRTNKLHFDAFIFA